jgi:hypothetical protein
MADVVMKNCLPSLVFLEIQMKPHLSPIKMPLVKKKILANVQGALYTVDGDED